MRSAEEPARPGRYRPGFWKPFGIVVAAWFGFGLISSVISDLVNGHDAVTLASSALPLGLIVLAVAIAPRWVVRVDPSQGDEVRFHTLFRTTSVRLQDIRAVRIGRSRRISVRHSGGRLYLTSRTKGWAEALEAARRVNPRLSVAARGAAWAIPEEAVWSLAVGAFLGVALSLTHARLTSAIVGAATALLLFGVGMVRWSRERRSPQVLAARQTRSRRRSIRTPRTWWVLPTSAGSVAGIAWATINWFAGTPSHRGVDTFLAFVAAASSTFVFWLAVVLVWRRLSSNGEHREAEGRTPS